MLKYLKVKDFALIDEIVLSFSEGLNVLTGETGAGKSLIVDCLSLISGGRADAQFVKRGREAATIEAAFDIHSDEAAKEALSAIGVTPEEEGVIILSREITKAGKSRARIDGRLVSAGEQSEAASCLIDIFGQHEGLNMLKPAVQLASIDSFLTEDGPELAIGVKQAYSEWEEAETKLSHLCEKADDRQARLDYLLYQIRELSEAAVVFGEEEALIAEAKMLANAGRLLELLNGAYAELYDTGSDQQSATELAKSAYDAIMAAEKLGIAASDVEEAISSAMVQLSEAAEAIRRAADAIESDPERASAVEARLSDIGRLKRKYRIEADELAAYLEKCKSDASELAELEVRTDSARAEAERRKAWMLEKMRRLSKLREDAADRMSKSVQARLAELMMPKAKFVVSLSPRGPAGASDLGGGAFAGPTGLDAAEFLFSANVGEETRPLAKVASGGELSRFMLAFKVAGRADSFAAGTLVFDEVDQGVGGAAAISVAAKLREASKAAQVLSVTHLAQIAAAADAQMRIVKGDDGKESYVKAELVEGDARTAEIARMLSGNTSPEAIGHARTLLNSWVPEKNGEKNETDKTIGPKTSFSLFEGRT